MAPLQTLSSSGIGGDEERRCSRVVQRRLKPLEDHKHGLILTNDLEETYDVLVAEALHQCHLAPQICSCHSL